MKTNHAFLAFFFVFVSALNAQSIHHRLKAIVDVPAGAIDVTDSVGIPKKLISNKQDTFAFYLNADLKVRSLDPSVKITEIKIKNTDTNGIAKTKKYMAKFPKGVTADFILPLQYAGKINGQIKTGAAETARGFSETNGIISNEGIYLSNSTVWVPYISDDLLTFDLTTIIDSSWSVVSQGSRTENKTLKNKRLIHYECNDPTDEVYLVAAKWARYSEKAGGILVEAVLRSPDSALAYRYINATEGYLELYNKLIGKYPYTRFTTVENFWETGYGMPSFTLLGPQVIRFPFILNSSYPHELLHNYWGNSVYVNGDKGNWCEGLTSYMADHLIKEQSGQGNEYRRTTLQKFTDFVNETNDFAIAKFTSRHNSAEEAIGYGKTLMVYEMLRYDLGDDVFKKAFSKFYQDNKFKKASFDDIEKSFEEVAGRDLKSFFTQWIQRTGAPAIRLSDVSVGQSAGKYTLSFTLSQTQKEEPFALKIPVVIYPEGNEEPIVKDFQLNTRTENFTTTLDKKPARIDVDPQFNVFRKLDKEEVPTSISQVLGAQDAVIILPKNSAYFKEYSELAEQWKETQNAQGKTLEIKLDSDLQELPAKPAWIIGFENKFAAGLNVFGNYSDYLPKETIDLTESLKKNGGLVYVFKSQTNKSVTYGFVGSNNPRMIEGIKRKVTHYSKYSYLGFEGDAAENKLKGEFPALGSPLTYYIKYEGKLVPASGKLKPRKALMY